MTSETRSTRVGEGARRWGRGLGWLLAALALVHPVASASARLDWRLDLITHWQVEAVWTSAAAAGCLLASRRRCGFLFLILACAQTGPILRYSLGRPAPDSTRGAPRLKILMANVFVDNPDYRALEALIRREKPDVVGLVEVSEPCLAALADVAREYSSRRDAPDGPMGLSLWFKSPSASISPPEKPTGEGWPYLRASFEFDGSKHAIWLVHPSSPLRRAGARPGFPELAAIGREVAATAGSRIVVGDLNTTDGSPYFRDFLEATGLRDSRRGFGRQPTWPDGWPVRIAIDHGLVSPDWAVASRRLGPSIGSDHRPLILELAPASPRARSTFSAHRSASSR